ncbi:MAG: cell division protein FtsZ, partial [Pseudomonadota bacterium]|nr:cell division protein FtsZ [Pseudomonadota bacterium]
MKFVGKETTPMRVPGQPVIKVVGLGGGGGNAVDYMLRSNVEGVEFMCANTDAQALANSQVETCIQLGAGGLGAGADPERGAQAAKEDIDQVKEQLKDANMVFITAGMGGGTGTGSAPVVAQAAREMGILTVGVVSQPFGFERRNKVAEAGIEALSQHVDSLITVPNDKLLKVLGRDFVLAKAFD